MKIINGKNLILGRLASHVAKLAIQGEDVVVLNCEDVVVTGKRSVVLEKYQSIVNKGSPTTGPKYHRGVDRIVRRTIRGMIPYKTEKGKEAFQRVSCFRGVPPDFEGKDAITIEKINIHKTKNLQYVTIKDISEVLGGK